MRTKVQTDGFLIPKELLEGVDEVEIRQEHGILIILPVPATDPILLLGTAPAATEVRDASTNHDYYLYAP